MSVSHAMGEEDNSQLLFYSSPDLGLVFNDDGLIIEANRTALEKLQYKPDELHGKSIYILHPAELRNDVEKFLKEILSGSRSFCPLPLVTKSGKLLYVETKLYRSRWNGEAAIFSISRDGSARFMAEETARKIEERYQVLFNNINDAVFVLELTEENVPGSFIEVNNVACDSLGYTREELLEMTPKEIYAPEAYAMVPSVMNKLKKKKHVVWEGIYITKHGVQVPVEISNRIFKMDNKQVVLATVRDITDRKRSEELLKQSEEKYRKIFENVQDIFYQADTNGRILEISPSIERYSGYKPEELIGNKVEDVYHNPEDRAELLKLLSLKGEIVDYVIKLKTKDNRLVYVSANIHLLYGPDNKPAGVEGSLRDVSERIIAEEKVKASEKLLRKQNIEYSRLNEELKKRNEEILLISKERKQASDIFMNIRTGLYIYRLEDIDDDRSLRMIAVNPAAERLTGIKAQDVVGRTLDENFPGLREKGIPADYAEVVRTKTPKQFEEITYGDHRVVEGAFSFNAFPLPDNCVGISFENITEQIKARESIIESNRQLQISKEKAEESDRLKSSFLANMSHEIRTPMNGIMGFSMMLADPSLTKDVREAYVRIVNSSCDQLLHIVNDIIDISRIEAGQIDLSESVFNLRDLFEELHSFYKSASKQNGVEFVLRPFPFELIDAENIKADRTKLRQVIDNLLSNAVKFTHSGKISMAVDLKGDYLQFEIEDTGIGIPDELQNVIFERFRQGETSLSKKYGGTGLGLSITKAYIEKMGGEIWLSSEYGKGSKFFFRLPYKSGTRKPVKAEPSPDSIASRENLTILVVEDEEINWLYLYEILKTSARTIHAANGQEAIAFIKQNPDISLVLMDIKLPDINGLELTKIIKSINSKINVIAQTAFALAGDREKAMEAGCSDYISKPINRENLLSIISKY